MPDDPGLPLLDLHDGHSRFRITLWPPYGRQVADLSMSSWQDALFEVTAHPFIARAETTLTGEEVEAVRGLIDRFHTGKDVVFGEDEQVQFSLTYSREEGDVLVTATLSTEGGPYPEIRFVVRRYDTGDDDIAAGSDG
ncbi:MAG TPA: hypothetical protein VF755_29590 [Catenuloplanes sp.]|jgi:hypothetical protein